MVSKPARTMPTTVLLPPKTRAKLISLAMAEQRSVSKQILVIIEKALREGNANA